DVRRRGQPPEHLGAAGVAQVECDALLAPVELGEHGGHPVALGRDAAEVVALAGLLDLDDACAGVHEQLARERSGQQSREVDDGDAAQRGVDALDHPTGWASSARRARSAPARSAATFTGMSLWWRSGRVTANASSTASRGSIPVAAMSAPR